MCRRKRTMGELHLLAAKQTGRSRMGVVLVEIRTLLRQTIVPQTALNMAVRAFPRAPLAAQLKLGQDRFTSNVCRETQTLPKLVQSEAGLFEKRGLCISTTTSDDSRRSAVSQHPPKRWCHRRCCWPCTCAPALENSPREPLGRKPRKPPRPLRRARRNAW